MTLANLSDEELLTSLTQVCFETRRLLGRLLLHLIEVEARRLELQSACSSMFDFCQRRLGMSEGEAFRRIDAARLVKRYPCLLDAIECGDLNLTTLLLLRDHFTTDNVDALVQAARGKTKRQVQELIAARAPKPDVFPTITELAPLPRPTPTSDARIEPLSESRHRLELTVSGDFRAKLERARDLSGHRDLETVLERAVEALLTKLEKERPGHGVRAEVRREVFARDGERCTYVDEQGNRCEARAHLELDHVIPRARGGGSDASNLRVTCRAHNRLYAEQAFGREHVEQRVYLRQRKSDALEVAKRALVHMGFREREVRRTLHRLVPTDAVPPLPELIRQALGSLTS